ncbi:Golgi apparatus membrane protein tvp18 [Savitreella phatthalungensis]
MTWRDELQSWNFSVYGQWLGILSIIFNLAFGIGNIFSSVIIFGIIAIVFGVILIFVEIPFLLRICPTNPRFDENIRKFNNNYPRAALYVVFAAVLWLSLIIKASSLLAAAILMTITAFCYLFAGVKQQEFTQSKTLGGAGLVQMVV